MFNKIAKRRTTLGNFKGFDGSAQISNKFIDKSTINIENINFSLKKNNKIVQIGNSADMIFKFDSIITYQNFTH